MVDTPDKRVEFDAGERGIVFFEQHILKSQSPRATSLELTKTLLGIEIARQSRLFSVPLVLESDLSQGSITFQRIQGVVTLHDLLFEEFGLPDLNDLLFRAGRALAAIHRNLRLPPEKQAPAPDLGLKLGVPEVAIHGDFAGLNLLYHRESDELWVVDWCTALWLGEESTLGPCYLDLGVMISSLFQRRVFYGGHRGPTEQLARRFLSGYEEKARIVLDLPEFSRYYDALMRRFRSQRRPHQGWLRSLAYLPSIRMGEQFLRRLSREKKSPSAAQ
jgi:tRNA A-37 threonylcarbamoyl transferase component Bud32